MNEKYLFGGVGLFDSPDDIIKAASETSEKGFKKFDVHTPYPVHGMDSAMKLKPSKLAYFSLVFGLAGTFSALALMYWTSSIDYPVIIGGKPFFSFPAYVPIMFELTVLLAAVMTVVTLISIFFKFPNISHPLHDTPYMQAVSSDRYGICIEPDENHSIEEIEEFLKSLGAKEVTKIYYDDAELKYKNVILQPKFLLFLALIAVVVSGATYFSLNKLMFMQPFNWMREQAKVIPQESSTFFADGFGMRMPVEGTVARENLPYLFKDQPEEAGKFLINPLEANEENLNLGRKKYDIYCSPCHGYFGEGDSRLRGQFPNPPSIHSEKVRNWSDGRIFHVITEGQNIMPSYSTQLTNNERWATILYLRVLQRSFNAKESDLR